MFGDAPGWLLDWGASAAALLSVLGLVALVSKTRPARWVWHHLVSDPVGHWLGATVRAEVEPVRAELAAVRSDVTELGDRVDGVATLTVDTSRALVDHMGDELELRRSDAAVRERERLDLDSWRVEVSAELRAVRHELAETLLALAAGNPEVRHLGPATATPDLGDELGDDLGDELDAAPDLGDELDGLGPEDSRR